MNLRWIPVLLAALAAALLVGFACGGGSSESTLDEYFKKMDALTQDIDKRLADLQSKYPNAFQNTKDTQGYLNDYVPTVKTAVDGLDKISPAKEAKDAHAQYVAAGRDFVKGIEAAAATVSKVQNDSDLEAALTQVNEDKDLTAASSSFDKACRDLQKIADDNNINVNLKCGEEAGGSPSPSAQLPLQDYYQQIEAIFQNADSETKQAQTELDSALNAAASVDDQISAVDSFLTSVSSTIHDLIGQMQVVRPPDEVRQYQSDFLAGANQTLKIADDLQSKLSSVKTEDDAKQVIDDFQRDSAPTEATTKAACRKLQDVANQQTISINLQCED